MARTSTARHFIVTVTVDGESLGKADAMDELSISADPVKHASSSFRGRRAALGSPPEAEDFTVSFFFDYERDHARAKRLRSRVGLGAVTVAQQPLDVNGSPYGQPNIITGILNGVRYPGFNSDSSDLSMLVLSITSDGEVG